jgi:hypothetical protein
MRRLIQFLKIIFSNKVQSAQKHYEHPLLIQHYQKLIEFGAYSDEEEILQDLNISHVENILIYGSGSGRECKLVTDLIPKIVGFEPVKGMIEISYCKSNIHYTSSLNDAPIRLFDAIWVTRFLPSFLNVEERKDFYREIRIILNESGIIYLRPDIMALSYKHTFRFKLASDLLRFFKQKYYYERGDTLRVNLDHFVGDGHFVFYHYYPSEAVFLEEILNAGFSGLKLPSGFFKLKAI